MPSSPPSRPEELTASDPELRQFVVHSSLAGPDSVLRAIALPGGVSCNVWKVETGGRTFCVKRALPRLRVAKLWEAPIARSEAEWNWLNFAAGVAPDAVPRALAHDAELAMLAIEYLEPAQYPVWKDLLLDGTAAPIFAATVARVIARIHAASADNPDVAGRFKTRESFYALRIEPYLLEAARQNPIVAGSLNGLAEQTLQTEIALVHGDLSPKNILVGSGGPVILDAETAWYGDPAFDVAFCLNHLLLKCVARPQYIEAYLACFKSLRVGYLNEVSWETPSGIESRAARLVPALLLARIDGKSPVEYLMPPEQSFVRDRAIELIRQSPLELDTIAQVWRGEVTHFHSRSEHPRGG